MSEPASKKRKTAEASGAEAASPATATVRQPAPAFSGPAVVDGQFKNISLEQYKGKWVVLFFYPLDFTFVCPTEICAFNDAAPEFKKINTELVACSVDSKFAHLAFAKLDRKKGGLAPCSMPLLSDITQSIGKSYGVHISDPDDEECGVTLRGLFIIDPNGTLRHSTVNDLPVGRSVEEVIRVVQAFQFHEEHGDVCPANWKPGKPTMKDAPKESLDYFSKHA